MRVGLGCFLSMLYPVQYLSLVLLLNDLVHCLQLSNAGNHALRII